LSTRPPQPLPTVKRGEIWLIDFDPSIGAEIQKVRPAIVVSSDAIGRLPLKLIAPITDWKNHYASNRWHVRLDPSSTNGLVKTSAVDAFQIKSQALERFVRKLGNVTEDDMELIVLAIATVIEYP
jgi:mRNA interferase MazF